MKAIAGGPERLLISLSVFCCSIRIKWLLRRFPSELLLPAPPPVHISLNRFRLELVLLDGKGAILEQLQLTELTHLANYSQPHAPGALLKAAFVCAEIVDLSSSKTLAAQLSDKYGCGFKLQSMSSLPQGSGTYVCLVSLVCPVSEA